MTHSEVVQADPGPAFAFVVGGAEHGIVRWAWLLSKQDTGSIVQQSWRLLRTDPVLGDTPEDLYALRDHMTNSAETTLLFLAEWIAGHRPQLVGDPGSRPVQDTTVSGASWTTVSASAGRTIRSKTAVPCGPVAGIASTQPSLPQGSNCGSIDQELKGFCSRRQRACGPPK
jgi:hypothetical protein